MYLELRDTTDVLAFGFGVCNHKVDIKPKNSEKSVFLKPSLNHARNSSDTPETLYIVYPQSWASQAIFVPTVYLTRLEIDIQTETLKDKIQHLDSSFCKIRRCRTFKVKGSVLLETQSMSHC